MSRNDAQDFAQRLYARVPAHYRVYDADQGLPLLALLTIVGEQAANLRQDLDALWDNFFIETCQDWAVPYIAELVGTNLLANPVGRSNRLEVRDTVLWRRSKGTPAMLRALAGQTSGWPTDFAEFFHNLGWSQNLNHVRLERQLTVDLRDPYKLSLLGRAVDPFAHAADFDPAADLDQPRITAGSTGIGNLAWGTPGRYQIRNLGFFVRRLQVFPVNGVTPAAVDPGDLPPAGASVFTFDPLHRELPLFSEATGEPITRAAFDENPSQYFGTDLGVRQFGILLANPPAQQPEFSSSRNPFTFGGSTGPLALAPANGLRLENARDFNSGTPHFVITASWKNGGPVLGRLSTLLALLGRSNAFVAGPSASGAGTLVITVEPGRSGLGFAIPNSPAGRFPGAVVAVRRANSGPARLADVLYAYLPPSFLASGQTRTYFVADDGSTYTAPDLNALSLARASEGQVYPAVSQTPSSVPAVDFELINRKPGALHVADPTRMSGASVLLQVELFTGAFQVQGAIATIAQPAASFPALQAPDPWPAFTFAPARDALSGHLPDQGTLTVLLKPISGDFIPASELVVTNREGQSLLVYLPELVGVSADGIRVFVADDGSTWFVPAGLQQTLDLFDGLKLARAATGQALPIRGTWPLEYRRPVAINLCRPERSALLHPGELGIDPERGRFAFAAGDPAIPLGELTVDYAEAFNDRVGALTFDRPLDPSRSATRFVSRSGDADVPAASDLNTAPVHTTVAAAVNAAVDGDIIEILDSATYATSAPIPLAKAAIRNLTIRAAAGQRPCLTSYRAPQTPAAACFDVNVVMDAFELNGLLLSGGPLRISTKVASLRLAASTFDPRTGISLAAFDGDLNDRSSYLLCRCVSGALLVGPGVAQLTVADSIVSQSGGISIAGLAKVGSPPLLSSPPGIAAPEAPAVQLERVTVMGRIHCGVLNASETILNDLAIAEDQQSGCIRFSRFEPGSVLPRKFQCIPSEEQAGNCTGPGRCFGPVFNSRRFGRPDYAQLATACPPEILSASEQRSEIGAFTGALNPIRLNNLRLKLEEFMPVGLNPVIIAET
jgi:hypothetical protein